jgi:uncharacterized protein
VRNEPEIIQAAAAGDVKRVRAALAAGADVDATSPYTTNIDRDLYEGTNTPLLLALRNDHEEMALLLLEHGANPDVADAFDGTGPIHEAAKRGFARVVDRLIDLRADLRTCEGYSGKSAVRVAIDGKHTAVALRLLAAGARALRRGQPRSARRRRWVARRRIGYRRGGRGRERAPGAA